jgi:hypothetical protein
VADPLLDPTLTDLHLADFVRGLVALPEMIGCQIIVLIQLRLVVLIATGMCEVDAPSRKAYPVEFQAYLAAL